MRFAAPLQLTTFLLQMDHSFTTPPQRQTIPVSMQDLLRISKENFISLLNDLPFQELHLQIQFISDDNDNSAFLRFVQELGRALSNVQIMPHAAKESPKKILSATLDRPIPQVLPCEEETSTKPCRKVEPLQPTTITQVVPSSKSHDLSKLELESQDNPFISDQEYAKRKRCQDILDYASRIESFRQGISS